MKEVHLKLMKWKIFKISSLTHYFFLTRKIAGTKAIFKEDLESSIMGNPDIIFIQTTLSYGSIRMQNPRRLFFIFSGVLKPKKLEGCFRRKVLEIFHTFK